MLVKVEHNPIRTLLVKQAIEMWWKHKMQITRGFTVKMAMQEARELMSKDYKATDYEQAVNDLNIILNPKVVAKIG